jgi:hypothetical protein
MAEAEIDHETFFDGPNNLRINRNFSTRNPLKHCLHSLLFYASDVFVTEGLESFVLEEDESPGLVSVTGLLVPLDLVFSALPSLSEALSDVL